MKRKVLFSLMCLLALLLAFPGVSSGDEYAIQPLSMTGYINAAGVNVRSGPGTQYPCYGSAGKGDVIQVVSSATAADGSVWYYGQVGGISGWVYSAYVSAGSIPKTPVPTAMPWNGGQSTLSFGATVTADSANVRAGASVDTAVVTRLYRGAYVTVLSSAMDINGALWYYCEYQSGRYGYIRADLVAAAVPVPTAAPTPLPVVPVSFTGYTNTSAVNVRSLPGGERIGRLNEGARVSVTGEITVDRVKWYRVSYSGGAGYIRADLISRSSPRTAAPTAYNFTETPLFFAALAVKDNCNVRRQPAYGADVLFRVNTGDALEVFSLCLDAGGAIWYHIRTADSRTGYILAELVMPSAVGIQTVPGADAMPGAGVIPGGYTGTDLMPGMVPDTGEQTVPGTGVMPGGYTGPDALPGGYPAVSPTLVPDVGGTVYAPAESAPPTTALIPDVGGEVYAPAASPLPDGSTYIPPEGVLQGTTPIPGPGGIVYPPSGTAAPEPTPQPMPFFVTSEPTPQPTPFFVTSEPTPQPTPFFVTSGPTARPTPNAAPPDLPSLDFNAFPSVPDQKLSVYSAPSVIAWRADGGSSSVNTTDNMWCAGYDGQWLLILYHTDSSDTAVGYVSALSLRGALPEAASLTLAACPAALVRPVDLTCDPLGQKGDSLPLKAGESVTWLGNCFLGSSWAYVETRVGGMPVRGFVPQDALQIQ